MDAVVKKELIHVAVGVVQNTSNEILVSRRKPNTHLENLLEFPGGKVEQGEQPLDALNRELEEELGIQVNEATQIIQVPYQYSQCDLLLDVFAVEEYSGVISANEEQEMFWQSIDKLDHREFPEANLGILNAIKMPKIYPVTPNYSDDQDYFFHLEEVISRKEINLIQLRSHDLDDDEFNMLAKRCSELCRKHCVSLILNRELNSIRGLEFAGIHLTSDVLASLTKRPLGFDCLVGASCHNQKDIDKANALKLDYVFLGAVQEKNGVNAEHLLGWDEFATLTKKCASPAYAIGGMQLHDIHTSAQSGGQGIAAIRSTWKQAS